jgi:hypothetical protein
MRVRVRCAPSSEASDLNWALSDLSAGLAVNYSSGYKDTSFTPNRDIDSYVTLDLNSSYQFGGNSSLRVVNQVSGYDGQQSVAVWQAVLDWYHQELIEDIGSSGIALLP